MRSIKTSITAPWAVLTATEKATAIGTSKTIRYPSRNAAVVGAQRLQGLLSKSKVYWLPVGISLLHQSDQDHIDDLILRLVESPGGLQIADLEKIVADARSPYDAALALLEIALKH